MKALRGALFSIHPTLQQGNPGAVISLHCHSRSRGTALAIVEVLRNSGECGAVETVQEKGTLRGKMPFVLLVVKCE